MSSTDYLSIMLADWDRASKASEFDRQMTSAIEAAVKTELSADIPFRKLKGPTFCLGP
jgi:hypothetical protein